MKKTRKSELILRGLERATAIAFAVVLILVWAYIMGAAIEEIFKILGQPDLLPQLFE